MSLKTLTKVSAVALVAALSVGCASTSDLEKVKQQAVAAQATANEAKQAADNALATANQCCADNAAKINQLEAALGRSYKHGMQK
jgi:predicted membrane-bound mannosyltransferase